NGIRFRLFRNGSWEPWAGIGAPAAGLTSGPAAVALRTNGASIDIAVLGADNNLYDAFVVGSILQRSWTLIPGKPSGVTLVGTPALASWSASHLDLFVNSSTGDMFHTFFENG